MVRLYRRVGERFLAAARVGPEHLGLRDMGCQ